MTAPIQEILDALRAPYLGPGRVLAIDGRRVDVELSTGARVQAQLALAFPYGPVVGDELLVIGQQASHWVIGVVRGAGVVDLRFSGDVALHAEGGALTLSGDRGVRVRGPELEVVVERLNVAATAAVEKFSTLLQRVRGLWNVTAGERHTIVEGTSLERAEKIALVAEQTASVNGKQILLG